MRHFRYFAVSRPEQNEVDDFSKSTSRLKSKNHDSSSASASVEPGLLAEQRQRRSGAYAEQEQRAPIVLSLAVSARARRCTAADGVQRRIWFSN